MIDPSGKDNHPPCDRADCRVHADLYRHRVTIPPMPAEFWERMSHEDFIHVFGGREFTVLLDERALEAVRKRCRALGLRLTV